MAASRKPASRACLGIVTLFAAALAQLTPVAAQDPPVDEALYQEEKLRTNAGAVSIMVSGLNCTCAQFAEDIRNVVNDLRPGGQRALISLGEGGPHNLKDAIFLLGVHMTIVDEHNLRALKESDPVVYGDVDQKIRYITKLYNAEFHILARSEVKSAADLDGKQVNVELKGSQTDLTAGKIFGALGIGIKPTHFDDALALKKLREGEIAAMVLATGAPQESLTVLRREEGLHFLPLDEASLPGRKLDALLTDYLPATLTSEAYPNLIAPGESVPTLASRMVLAIYNWPENGERYQRNTKFIGEFFSRIDQFSHPSRHPKWAEVNIAAEVPGWTRFKPAQDWLDKHHARPAAESAGEETAAFERFLLVHQQSRGGKPVSARERNALLAEFRRFLAERRKR